MAGRRGLEGASHRFFATGSLGLVSGLGMGATLAWRAAVGANFCIKPACVGVSKGFWIGSAGVTWADALYGIKVVGASLCAGAGVGITGLATIWAETGLCATGGCFGAGIGPWGRISIMRMATGATGGTGAGYTFGVAGTGAGVRMADGFGPTISIIGLAGVAAGVFWAATFICGQRAPQALQ